MTIRVPNDTAMVFAANNGPEPVVFGPILGEVEQYLELPGVRLRSLANAATRTNRHQLTRDKRRMQDRLAAELRRHLERPELPCIVTMVREAPGTLDEEDNLPGALKYVRDTIARWAHGLDERCVARYRDGRPRLNRRGRVMMTRPPAPDGPNDGIEWAYDQVRAREAGFHALHVIISRRRHASA